MKRMKFRILSCVALILAFVMWFEIPASAAALDTIVVSDYYTGSSIDGSNTVKRYYYPSSSSYMFCQCISGSAFATLCDGQLSRFDHTFALNTASFMFFYNPMYSKSFNGDSDVFKVSDLSSGSPNSLNVSIGFDLYSSVPVTGNAELRASFSYKGNSKTVSAKEAFSLSPGTYNPFFLTVDLLDSYNLSSISNLTFQVLITIPSAIPAGSTFIFEPTPSDNNELNPGVSFVLSEEFKQEAPKFNTNLSSNLVSYLVGAAPDPLIVDASVSDGGSVTYQWYKSSSATAAGTAITGAIYDTYSPPTNAELDCYYYCVATSKLSGYTKSTTSNVAHVSVVTAPMKPQVVSDLNNGTIEYYQGASPGALSFGVVVTDGGSLSYQWYQKTSSDNTGSAIVGATAAQYTPVASEIGMTYYYCVATNTKGTFSESVTSGVVGVRIVSPPDPAKAPVITADLPSNPFTYTQGDAATPLRIGVTSPDGGELTYQWYQLVDGAAQLLAGEIYPSFTPATGVPGEYTYYCVVTNTLPDSSASVQSSNATVVIEKDQTESLLESIIGGVTDIIDGIKNLPQLILDGIKNLFIPDTEGMAAYRDKWFELLSSRFGAIYEAVMLIDEFGQAISEQAKQGIVTFPEVTIDLAGSPWTFGGWDVKVVPDGFDAVINTLRTAINIVCTFAFLNGLRHRFEGVIGGA